MNKPSKDAFQLAGWCHRKIGALMDALIPYQKIVHGETTRLRARVFVFSSLISALTLLVVGALRLSTDGPNSSVVVILFFLSYFSILLYCFSYTGWLNRLSDILVVSLFLCVFLVAFLDGGVFSRSMVWLPVSTFIGSILAHKITVRMLVAINFLILAILGALHHVGHIEELAEGRWFVRMLTVFASVLVVAIIARMYEIELGSASRSLIKAREKAEIVSRYKSEFLANMSHEIRTPMNGVVGMLNLLSREELSDQQQKLIAMADTSANSLLSVINDVLDYSKIESGKLELQYERFDIVHHVSSIVKGFALAAQEKNLEIIIDCGEVELKFWYGDEARIAQILNNLVGNAIKFTSKGHVLVRASTKKHEGEFNLTYEIIDSGVGVDDSKQKHIFDAFSQEDGSVTRHYGGTGLGLAIVKKLCVLMDGVVTIQSRVGEGSCFKVLLPLPKASVKDLGLSASDVKPAAKDQCILFVSDKDALREAFSRQLSAWGYSVKLADSASSALGILNAESTNGRSNSIFCGIIDDHLGEIGALELAKKIRQSKVIHFFPIVKIVDLKVLFQAGGKPEEEFSSCYAKPLGPSDILDILVKSQSGFSEEIRGNAPRPNAEFNNKQDSENISTDEFLDDSIKKNEALNASDARVLLVDDQQINVELASMILEDLGIDFDTANDGLEAIACLKDRKYHLVLMDCQMPNMDGYEATKQIRNGAGGEQNKLIPIIALTAHALRGDREKCISAGMNDFLTKPLDITLAEERVLYWAFGNKKRD